MTFGQYQAFEAVFEHQKEQEENDYTEQGEATNIEGLPINGQE